MCWYRAFREHGVVLPIWRLHRHVGMGGDNFVPAVAGEEVESRIGDHVRDRWEELFDELIDEVAAFDGAHELMRDLKERGRTVVLASSSIERHLDHYLDLLDARELLDGWTTKDDVEATKPEPDLVQAALEKAGSGHATMLGDTPWDVEAARKAGLETVCLVTGGFSEQELREAGAVAVFASIPEVRGRLEELF